MGFECGFSFIPRLKGQDDVDNFKRYHATEKYLLYVDGEHEWYKNNFATFEGFYNETCDRALKIEDFKVDFEEINILKNFKEKFNLGKYDGYSKDIMSWCSIGHDIDRELFCKGVLGDYYEIVDSVFMEGLDDFIDNNRDKPLYSFVPVGINKGFTVKKDEDDPDEDVIILKNIDGVEILTDDGFERVYCDDDMYLYRGDSEYNEMMNALIAARDTIDIVMKDYIVYYWRSY